MRKYFVLILLILMAYQNQAQQVYLSPNLKLFLQTQQKENSVHKKSNRMVAAFIKVNTQVLNEQALLNLGVRIGTKAKNIWTVQIPENKLQQFVQLKGLLQIQMDEPVAVNMNVARRASRVDSVHKGTNLPIPYTGKNVVVGIIDAGFDYGHPTFYDTSGKQLRIKRIWEQHKMGTPPTGYSYGNEITDTAQMILSGNDVASFSHGTHVGGIAAGSGLGAGNDTTYKGIAYESDLVFVGIKPQPDEWTSMGMTSIVDAVNYIFTYAESQNKPAVANLSWGCSIGPNDGSSLVAQALDNLTGPGKIFVVSAGNNGDEKIHLTNKDNVSALTITYLNFPVVKGEKRTWVDVWGEKGKELCVSLLLYNGNTLLDSSMKICAINNQTVDTFLIGLTGDTLFYKMSAAAEDPNNEKNHVLLDLFNKSNRTVAMRIDHGGKYHAWMGLVNDYTGYYGAFSNNGLFYATNGDSSFTLGEMSCTRSAITVAAFTTKTRFRNLAGSNVSYSGYTVTGALTPFSSHGPTADLRNKPDVAAPGMTLASAVNSYDLSYANGGSNYGQSVAQFVGNHTGRTYYYAEASGTSMAAPMVSGIVALMLQVNPSLTPERIKDIFKQTAILDNFTTANPNPNFWGVGKVNAYGAVKRAVETVGLTYENDILNKVISLFPNPAKNELNIVTNDFQYLDYQITDITGKIILSGSTINNKLNISELQNGMYIITFKSNGSLITTHKFIKN